MKAPSSRWTLAGFVPQRSILAHPNVLFFVSHCGSGGLTESMYFEVPILCIPIQDDQPFNAKLLHEIGFPEPIIGEVSVDRMRSALEDLIVNRTNYKALAKMVRNGFDFAGGLDRAVHLCLSTMRIKADDLRLWRSFEEDWAWWQIWNLDIFLVGVVLGWAWFTISKKVMRLCCLCCCRAAKKVKKD